MEVWQQSFVVCVWFVCLLCAVLAPLSVPLCVPVLPLGVVGASPHSVYSTVLPQLWCALGACLPELAPKQLGKCRHALSA